MLTRSKYKVCSPFETINRISKILKEIGINVSFESYSNTGHDFSCRLIISNNGLKPFDIGVNGKGMSEEYAKASAYGELMERLQNKALFRENIIYFTEYFQSHLNTRLSELYDAELEELMLKFQYFPDEQHVIISEPELSKTVIPSFFPGQTQISLEPGNYDCIYAPFLELCTNTSGNIPVEIYRAMCGSTGMCAGNTREEALVQGLNEICERFVLMKLFTKRYSLPEIPLTIFEGHYIYERLKELENDYKIVIKDCSLGMNLPVMGLLLINRKTGEYAFRLGADFNMITALERCFTESFQGENADKQIFNTLDVKKPIDESQYIPAVINGTGRFPHSVLYNSEEPYKFPHFDFKSYEEELCHYIDIAKKIDTQIYVKDNSFLGFPAFTIYVPKLSCVDYPLFKLDSMLKLKNEEYRSLNPLLNITNSLFCNNSPHKKVSYQDVCVLQKWNSSKSAKMPGQILRMFLNISMNKYDEAFKAVEDQILNLRHKNVDIPKSMKCAHDLLFLLTNHNDIDIVRNIYGQSLVNEYMAQFQNVKAFIAQQPFPRCFQCKICQIKETCHLKEILLLEKKLQTRQVNSSKYGEFI